MTRAGRCCRHRARRDRQCDLLRAGRAGVDVVGIEQFELGHARGASHDHSRIIRRSYHTPGYVELAGAAYGAWARRERRAARRADRWDRSLPAGAVIPIEDYTGSLAAAGVPFEVLDAAEIMQRWPQWKLASDVTGLFQADTGIVAAEVATEAMAAVPRDAGARLFGRHRRPFLQDGDGVEVG